MSTRHRLLAEERHQKILELLERNDRVLIDELVARLKVSAVTVRSDLDSLSDRGLLVRSHGGAVRQINPTVDYPLQLKATLHHAEKVRIGLAAAQLLRPNQTVMLDSGTTTAEVARHIRSLRLRPLTVITNALNIAVEVAGAEGVSLLMIGGLLRRVSSSFVGPQAERMLQDLHADHMFLAVDGMHLNSGLSTPDILEAQLNSLMMRAASEVTVVADASKFGRRSLSVIAGIDEVRRVITDDRVKPETLQALQEKGIEVVVV
jgi:DeoR family transcriptional regulator of aga operon